jgi:hypothetical protein
MIEMMVNAVALYFDAPPEYFYELTLTELTDMYLWTNEQS